LKPPRSGSSAQDSTLLRARVVLPISRPPIENGGVLISKGRIVAVGRWRDLLGKGSSQPLDLGEVALLPGLVNAHCHLDYTLMAGQFAPPKAFTDWLKLITETKSGWDYSDFAESWLAGAQMLLRSGTTFVADIEAVPQLLPEVWHVAPLRVLSFLEMIGITGRRPPEVVLSEAVQKLAGLRHSRCQAGLSPHAPYSTVPELLRLTARAARRRRWLLCIHLAESAFEFDMFAHRRGPMFEWLQRSGRDMSDCGRGSPVRHLDNCGLLGPNLLAAHVNHLDQGDAALLARRGVSVVHCPRSHSYFRHAPFPLRRLLAAGVNICLGTDSLASVYKTRRQTVELDMFEEMRALADREPSLSGRHILAMATTRGARALRLEGKIGELAGGAYADVIALPLAGRLSKPYEAVLEHRGPVSASMIAGQWALAPTQVKLSASQHEQQRL
jgi:cytosine/adenosine deaminase-related metal-dependent hydrolase